MSDFSTIEGLDDLQQARSKLVEERRKLDAGWGALSDAWAELANMHVELEDTIKELSEKNFTPDALARASWAVARSKQVEKRIEKTIRRRRRIIFEDKELGAETR